MSPFTMLKKRVIVTPLALSLSATIFSGLIHHNAATAVTGVHAGVDNYTNARPFRTEINAFAQSGPAFDLYIQALMTFQNQSGDTGYFEIAGIHGYPLDTWQGANPLPGASKAVGYCTHISTLFPIWHRPYLALFEQIMWDLVRSIATQYPYSQQSTYLAAVDTWRIPYWDWADIANPPIPPVVATPEISINTISGWQTVKNPLYTYRFPDYPRNIPNMTVPGYDYSYMEDRLYTIRHPTTGLDPGGNGTQNDTRAYDTVAAGAASLHQMTYLLLSTSPSTPSNSNSSSTIPSKFNSFATDASHALSIEQIHDQIHDWVGGPGGHMYYITWSAFDPIFWLHHANIDRVFAIWQALNPDDYIVALPQEVNPATFASPAAQGGEDTELFPFRRRDDNGTGSAEFHTPATVRETKVFGYTYPELVDWGANTSAAALRSAVIARVNELYNTPTSVNGSSNSSSGNPQPVAPFSNNTFSRAPSISKSISNANVQKRTPLSPAAIASTYPINNLPTQYILNLSLPVQPSSLTLYFYLGAAPPSPPSPSSLDPDPDPAAADPAAATPPNLLLATHSIFSSAPTAISDRLYNLTDPVPGAPLTTNTTYPGSPIPILGLNITLHAHVPLTASLLSLVLSSPELLPDLSLPAVETLLLRECVTWRVRGGGGGAGGLEGLTVQVLQRDVVPTKEVGAFPIYGGWRGVGACVGRG